VKVLIAEDDRTIRLFLQHHLTKNGFEVVATSDGKQAWALLQVPGAPRLAILDWEMPGMDGPEVCLEARKRVAQPYVYIILLTARSDKAEVIHGLEAGADDYLIKPFHPQELLARLRAGQRILTLEDNLMAARDVLTFQATHDSLTGLWNRAAVLDTLRRELVRCWREHRPLGVLLVDLDHFKSINDTYGHVVGDQVLRETASRLRHQLRDYDTVGRYGGEEFLIVLPGCDAAVTGERAAKLREGVSLTPMETTDGPVHATMSLGGVCCPFAEPLEATAVLCAADAALYRAKAAGRNRVEMAALEEIEGSTGMRCDAQPIQKIQSE
jgi:two-component system cell cycle response regulator